MISHETIWLALDRLAEEMGYSPSGLARKAGLDPTAFNKSKRLSPEGKPRWPSTESIAKVLSVTGQSMERFVMLVEMPAYAPPPQPARPVQQQHSAQAAHQQPLHHPQRYVALPAQQARGMHQSIVPIAPIEALAHPAHLNAAGQPSGGAWRPVALEEFIPNSESLIAVEMTDGQFAPIYRAGDVLLVQPESQPRRGDRVLVVLQNGQGITLGNFVRKTRDRLEITDLMGQQSLVLAAPQIRMLARVVLVTQ